MQKVPVWWAYFVKRRCSSHISDFQLPKEIRDDYDFPKQMYTIWGTTFSLLPTRTNFPPIFSPPLWFNELHWCNKYTTRLHHVARFHKRLEKINAFWKWKSSWLGILLWVLNKKFLCNDKKHNTITLTYLELLAVYIWPELLETNKPVGSWSQASIHYY